MIGPRNSWRGSYHGAPTVVCNTFFRNWNRPSDRCQHQSVMNIRCTSNWTSVKLWIQYTCSQVLIGETLLWRHVNSSTCSRYAKKLEQNDPCTTTITTTSPIYVYSTLTTYGKGRNNSECSLTSRKISSKCRQTECVGLHTVHYPSFQRNLKFSGATMISE